MARRRLPFFEDNQNANYIDVKTEFGETLIPKLILSHPEFIPQEIHRKYLKINIESLSGA